MCQLGEDELHFPNFCSCMFQVQVGYKKAAVGDAEAGREAAALFSLIHTVAYLLAHLIGVRLWPALQLSHHPWILLQLL